MKKDIDMRVTTIERATKETQISCTLNLDGSGVCVTDTGIPFFDHMMEAFARHSLLDLGLTCTGDLEVDAHHSVEDCGIVMGQCVARLLGDRAGITRFGEAIVPMDEALVMSAVDISGRGALFWDVEIPIEIIGTFDSTLAKEFFVAFATNAGLTLHISSLAGENAHHIVECVFKSVARSFMKAVSIEPRHDGHVPSTKGVL